MKNIFLIALSAFVFLTASSQNSINIKVPDFADAKVKAFYARYADHLIKCVEAIRQKDENKVAALFRNPGEQLVAEEKILSPKVVKDPVEKKKYLEYATQVYPYLKEVENSTYYQKMYGGKKAP
jgi:hypothetical protein